ncbi:ORF1 [Grizzly bear anellovirus 3]|nr:ORF1 [Grizzly bear anellovirus 3]
MPYIARRRWRGRRFSRRRHLIRYRRRPWWRRRWPRGRIYRRRKQTVRQNRPRWVRHLVIKGVEFLGVLGSKVEFIWSPEETTEAPNLPKPGEGQWRINITNIAPVNKESKYWQKIFPTQDEVHNECGDRFNYTGPSPTYWDFVGGFGQAHFTLENLIWRTIFGFARFNITLEGIKYIKFAGFRFLPQRAPTLNYLFLADNHTQGRDYKTPLIHPVNLLNTPGTVIVNSIQRTKCCRGPQIKRRADPGIFAWTDLEDFMKVPLASYVWTFFNPNNPMGRNDQITKQLKSPLKNQWMRDAWGAYMATYCPSWSDRETYDNSFVSSIDGVQANQGNNWWEFDWGQNIDTRQQNPNIQCEYGRYSPFLPPVAAADTPETFWMRYEFFFQIGGGTYGFKRQPWPVREYDVCFPCKPKENAYCDSCIDPEKDLDRYGLLKKASLERIAASPLSRKKRFVEKLARLVQLKRKRQKRVRFADERHTLHLGL